MQHLFCKIYGPVENGASLLTAIRRACSLAGAECLGEVAHVFQPQGFSAVVLLAESHASLHTWPEKGFALIDYFSCAEDPRIDVFLDVLEKEGYRIEEQQIVER